MSSAAPLQTATAKPVQTGGANLLLQRKCACGGGPSGLTGECAECSKKKLGIQTKLRINEPGDVYEQEADRVAAQVMAEPAHAGVSSAPLRIQRYTGQATGQADTAPASVDRVLARAGRPLEPALRQDMEQRFGHDFSRVRVHSDGAAEQSALDVNAHAYTAGHNVVFGPGRFVPQTHEGRTLLAHELTHVVQQSHGGHQVQRWASCKPARMSMEDCPPRQSGEAQRAHSSPMVFLPSLKIPITGEEGVLIANFDIGVATIKPNLHETIYWKQFLKHIAANHSRWTLLGFSDCQGEERLNNTLREDRAAAIFNVLPPQVKSQVVAHEAAPTYDCITENDTAAARTLNRGVAFQLVSRSVALTAEDVPPNVVCGPDVTRTVEFAVARLRSDFDRLSNDEQEDVCGTLNSALYGLWTWDIPPLYHENNSWIVRNYRPDGCASKGATPPCGETVQVGDQCYYSGTANYVVFGAMCRLCQQNLDQDDAADYDEEHMLELIDFYKGPGIFTSGADNYEPARQWAQAGYDGWPNGGTPPRGDRSNCLPRCPIKYWNEPFQVRWCPHLDPYNQCHFWSRRRSARRISPGRP